MAWLKICTREEGSFIGYGLVALLMVSSLLAVIYIWRVVEVAYFRDPPDDASRQEAPLSLIVPTWILILGSFYFGIGTSFNVGFAKATAAFLMGGA